MKNKYPRDIRVLYISYRKTDATKYDINKKKRGFGPKKRMKKRADLKNTSQIIGWHANKLL